MAYGIILVQVLRGLIKLYVYLLDMIIMLLEPLGLQPRTA